MVIGNFGTVALYGPFFFGGPMLWSAKKRKEKNKDHKELHCTVPQLGHRYLISLRFYWSGDQSRTFLRKSILNEIGQYTDTDMLCIILTLHIAKNNISI